MHQYLKWVAGFATVAVLAACGGGGSGDNSGGNVCLAASCGETSSSSSSSSSGGSVVASLALSVSAPTLSTDGASTITLLVTAKDASNGGAKKSNVKIAASSGTLSASSGVTDDNGRLTFAFDTNTDKTSRTVTFTATANGLTATNSVVISGTALKFSGVSAAIVGKPVQFVVGVVDGGGVTIPGASIKLTSSLGNPVPATLTTSTAGVATIAYTPTKGGVDTITATSFGATGSVSITTSNVDFAFSSPSPDSLIEINTCLPVAVVGAGFATTPSSVLFTTTRGALHALPDCSDAKQTSVSASYSGTAAAYVRSSSTGATTVTATALDGAGKQLATTTLPVTFISTTPSSITIQASPSTVIAGTKATISGTVRDTNGNPVYGKTVAFAVSGGGQLEATTSVSDANGNVSVSYTADGNTSGYSTIGVTATVQGSSVTGVSSITVSGVAINIVVGTDNKMALLTSPPRYQLNYGASVTDSNGSPVANKTVTISLIGTKFYKGYWFIQGLRWWPKQLDECVAEDTNNDGLIQSGEPGDLNGNGTYQPNGAATVSATPTSTPGQQITVTTDALGYASFYVTYLQNYASWVKVNVSAKTTVNGATSEGQARFDLPEPAAEVVNIETIPPFRYSPFGKAAGCNNLD